MDDVSFVVRDWKARSRVSLRDFARHLNRGLPADKQVTHAAVSYWVNGDRVPSTDYLVYLLLKTRDWRFDFALACLSAINEEVWGSPDGEMWRLGKQLRGE